MNYYFKIFSYHVFFNVRASAIARDLSQTMQSIVLTLFSDLTHRCAKKSTRPGYRPALS
jgi:hypothetical protein